MTTIEELADIDASWDEVNTAPTLSLSPATEPPSEGTFGHPSERRLGLRVPAACWALVKDNERSVYARTVEISPTGAVLKLLDGSEPRFDRGRRFELDIFVPGASRPVHAVAWPARSIGQLEAFEFLTMSAADRLTLAEHIDTLLVRRPDSKAPPVQAGAAAPPVYWKNFVLSLKPSRAASTRLVTQRAPAASSARRL